MSMELIILAGLAAYANSFRGVFIFDDYIGIIENTRIRQFWPLWPWLVGTTRPLTELSFAMNYMLGGLDVRGYHVVNLTIHILAALALFGVARRTFLSDRLRDRHGRSAQGLALAIALIWLVHPLQVQSVTYLYQRAESLMGLCYLMTLYCVIRGAILPRSSTGNAVVSTGTQRGWYLASVIWCALGMASKQVMVTAPVVVWLYDRVFLSGSWRGALRQRRGLYLGLASTWAWLALLHITAADLTKRAQFELGVISPLTYAVSQPGVILHYLRLSLWPNPLVLDYFWPPARTVGAILPPTLAVLGLVVATCWALRRWPPLGFLGTCFFLLLAPTSSVIPIADLAFEHRMYLPLAAVVSLLVLGGVATLEALLPSREHVRRGMAGGLIAVCVGLLGFGTVQRNADYQSEVAFWADTVAKRPENPRAHNGLAHALIYQGNFQEAVVHAARALQLYPRYVKAHNNLGVALAGLGRYREAEIHLEEAIRLQPEVVEARINLGNVLAQQGRLEEAAAQYMEVLRFRPDLADVHNNLGNVLAQQGRLEEAAAQYMEALRINPDLPEARSNLELALRQRHGT